MTLHRIGLKLAAGLTILGLMAVTAFAIQPKPTLRIMLPKEEFKIGEKIPIFIAFRNESLVGFTLPRAGRPARSYEIIIARTDGQEIQERSHQTGPEALSFMGEWVGPGEEINEKMLLNEEFDLGAKGNYSVKLRVQDVTEDRIPLIGGMEKLDSNKVYFTVK